MFLVKPSELYPCVYVMNTLLYIYNLKNKFMYVKLFLIIKMLLEVNFIIFISDCKKIFSFFSSKQTGGNKFWNR
jgi:hypothetical protein